ncbi:MAG: radical SAM protein [Clostridia bacterium]|nr:radical SAM protein [Clostridia bacterium]
MMYNSLAVKNSDLESKMLSTWFDEITLPVAPACNMMCNFCSKDCDCICNGNSPECLSKPMTPKQAVNWAQTSANKNKRLKIIKISGPGEPLCNSQTFEVLRRLNLEMPDSIYSLYTNGLQLDEKADELARLNVRSVTVSVNAIYPSTIMKLYSRLIKNSSVVMKSPQMASILVESQFKGIKKCMDHGIAVKVSSIYFPGINEDDIPAIAYRCREMGIYAMTLLSCYPNGKFVRAAVPSISELVSLQHELSKIVKEVEIKSFIPSYHRG